MHFRSMYLPSRFQSGKKVIGEEEEEEEGNCYFFEFSFLFNEGVNGNFDFTEVIIIL